MCDVETKVAENRLLFADKKSMNAFQRILNKTTEKQSVKM